MLETQFRRVLDQIMKTNLTEDEVEQLINKYDTKNNSAVNYRLFCNVVNKSIINRLIFINSYLRLIEYLF